MKKKTNNVLINESFSQKKKKKNPREKSAGLCLNYY